MRHPVEEFLSSFFGDTTTSTTTPQSPKLPRLGKEHLGFQIEWKSAHAAKCVKSKALIKVLRVIFEIDSFEQQCVIMEGLLQSENMVSIGVDQ